MNRLGAILYGLAAGTIFLLFSRESIEPAIWLLQERAGDTVVLAVIGWLIATLGPAALSMCAWLAARRLRSRWLLHMTLILTEIVMFRQGSLLFFYGVKASGDSSPEGFALLMAASFLTVAIFAHTVALVMECYRAITHRASVS